ncbi:hypothetical protein CCUS01_05894 [Colletotrichum cuscutae]|uniref:Uncharacterized protein n=1 Tax=Colletotrichum cuscutae TaxID=1209917 RepID=A0AAI9V668_9PEZI|nr:hypothetical protein CCUS01_05894 [Colletotrichum cuscutae]
MKIFKALRVLKRVVASAPFAFFSFVAKSQKPEVSGRERAVPSGRCGCGCGCCYLRLLLAVGERTGGSGTESARAPHLPILSIRRGRQVGSVGDPLPSFAFVPSKFRLFPLTSSSSLPRSTLIRSALVPTGEFPLCLRHARQMQNPAPECREMTSPREGKSNLQPQRN